MKPRFEQSTWPAAELGLAIEHLSRKSGLSRRALSGHALSPSVLANREDAGRRWIEAAVPAIGLDVESEDVTYASVDALLASLSVALVECHAEGTPRYLAVLASDGRRLTILAHDLRHRRVAVAQARAWLCGEVNLAMAAATAGLLNETGLAGARRDRARLALDRELAGETRVARCYQIRASAGSSFVHQLRDTGNLTRLAGLVVAHGVQYGLLIASWAMIGRAALQGRFDRGWLSPGRCCSRLDSRQALRNVGERDGGDRDRGRLRRRLLAGALALEPDETAQKGAGQFRRRCSNPAVESLALGVVCSHWSQSSN
jgi:ATP-binding cassette subfamily B protein